MAFCGCGKGPDQAAAVAAPVPVELRGVHRAEVQRSVAVTGTLTGQEEAVISARVAGPVAQVLRDLGDRVGPGDELARLDPSDYRLAEAHAAAALQEALAKLGLVRLPEGDLDVEALPGVARARLLVENAGHRFQRFQPTANGGNDLISAQDLEDLGNRVEIAKRDLQAERIASQALLAQARTAKAELDLAAKRLADTSVRVPDLGVAASVEAAQPDLPPYSVAARLVAPGEWVKEGTNLYRVVADRALKLKADVPERFAGELARGQLVAIELAGVAAPVIGRV
ncbi:MAG: efflux RND transporter periplasmic adaptor subunit, partial [Planctomycetes bacterium]|nr:efflux RND transporter periplasmic adaptor subunit [Planctomycetota bacterium]